MEIYTCNIDGSDMKQITHLGKANWAPFFHPSGKKIIFSSNHHSTGRGFNFQLFMMNDDGTGVEQITETSIFNAFPMFSPDGKKLVWASNRNAAADSHSENTDLYIADWRD
jgi:Tol biopolymer transport system component